MAIVMILRSGQWQKHLAMSHQILHEWKTIKIRRSSQKLLGTVSRMALLPYGIPMAIGSIAYFAIAGMLV